MILCYITDPFKNKYHDSIFMTFCLFTLTSHGRAPASPLITYNIKFVQRGFSERSAGEERIYRDRRGLAVQTRPCWTQCPPQAAEKTGDCSEGRHLGEGNYNRLLLVNPGSI